MANATKGSGKGGVSVQAADSPVFLNKREQLAVRIRRAVKTSGRGELSDTAYGELSVRLSLGVLSELLSLLS